MTKLLTEPQAAEHLGIDTELLAGLREANQGPAFYRFGRRVAYRTEDLDAFLEERPELWERVEPESPPSTPESESRPTRALSPVPRPTPPAVDPAAAGDLSEEELKRRRDAARSLVQSSDQPKTAPDCVHTRRIGKINSDDGTEIDAPNPYAGMRPAEMAGFGEPPELED
jgi:hypothetical protein